MLVPSLGSKQSVLSFAIGLAYTEGMGWLRWEKGRKGHQGKRLIN